MFSKFTLTLILGAPLGGDVGEELPTKSERCRQVETPILRYRSLFILG